MHRHLAACAALLLLVLICAGCGSPSPRLKPPAQTHPCRPHDTTLGCQLPPVTAPVPPAPQPAPVAMTLAVASSFRSQQLIYGIDFGWGGGLSVSSMRANGFRFGASYLSYDFSKNWPVKLIRTYQHAGIARVFVWETTANRALSGCLAGTSDALAARAQSAGFARVIYFAVDFEEQPSEVATIAGYFRCAGRLLGRGHIGAYGGYWTVAHLFDEHLIGYGWQTYAWSGGRWDPRAQLEQYLNGASYDRDRAITRDYGQTPYTSGRTPAQIRAAKVKSLHAHERLRAELHGDIDRHHCRRGQHNTPREPLRSRLRFHRLCGDWIKRGGEGIATIGRYHREGIR